MTSTDSAPVPARYPNGVEGRSAAKRITGKLRTAIDAMIWEGLSYQDAAQHAGLTVRLMRMALERPHVIAYLKAQRQVFRNSVCAKNDLRLAEIRDAANNMPAVNAIKALEQIGDDEQRAGSIAQQSPGLVIVLQGAQDGLTVSAHQRALDAKPLIEHDMGARRSLDEGTPIVDNTRKSDPLHVQSTPSPRSRKPPR